ncbi:hypothetical protein SRHO_G00111920 [Serrasalmus rhombeus]
MNVLKPTNTLFFLVAASLLSPTVDEALARRAEGVGRGWMVNSSVGHYGNEGLGVTFGWMWRDQSCLCAPWSWTAACPLVHELVWTRWLSALCAEAPDGAEPVPVPARFERFGQSEQTCLYEKEADQRPVKLSAFCLLLLGSSMGRVWGPR